MRLQTINCNNLKTIYAEVTNEQIFNTVKSDEVTKSRYSNEMFSDSLKYCNDLFKRQSTILHSSQKVSLAINEINLSNKKEHIEYSWNKAVDAIIADDSIEFLECSKLEVFFEKTLIEYNAFEKMGEKLIDKYYKLNANSDIKVIAILHALSHIDYKKIDLIGPSIAGRCLSNKNIEIIEFALKCFENWSAKDELQYLESLKLREEWLDDYLQKIIQYIKGI